MSDSTATVRSRAESLTLPALVGKTVAEVRRDFASVINIADNAYPTINGDEVDESTTVYAGDVLVFTVPTGSKG